jgi:hypothetical protein
MPGIAPWHGAKRGIVLALIYCGSFNPQLGLLQQCVGALFGGKPDQAAVCLLINGDEQF